jgi:hypothetical protein
MKSAIVAIEARRSPKTDIDADLQMSYVRRLGIW